MKNKFLDLGLQPIANNFLAKNHSSEEYLYHLEMSFDEESGLVSQVNPINSTLMFNETYPYRASMSETMKAHFREISEKLQNARSSGIGSLKVLEIGSNDGVFIKNWDKKNIVAVEPCLNFANETNNLGYKTYNSFWGKETALEIKENHGLQDVIFSANCVSHIHDLDDTFSAVSLLLADDGVFVFEDPSLSEMIKNGSYDQIYDEHLHIFSITSLDKIACRHNLQIIKVDNLTVHGGSNRVFVSKAGSPVDRSVEDNKTYERILGLNSISTFHYFADQVERSRGFLTNVLQRCKEEAKKVISYGATAKSTTIFNYCDIGPDLIDYITDTTPEKQNKLSPGMHIPIIRPEEGFNESVDFAFLGAWNFIKEIKEKEKDFSGKFITHVPTVRIV